MQMCCPETSVEETGLSESISRKRLVASYVLTGVVALFLIFDTVLKLLRLEPAVKGTAELGYPPESVLSIGLMEVVCLVAFLVPRTAVMGAILLTGYLGGAIATHFRIGNPLLSHTLFPVYVALMVWGGLYLRDARVRGIVR